jgi:membrane protease YdiL (CAAX protease family)
MEQRSTLPAWLVAALFAPLAVGLWVVGFGIVQMHPAHMRTSYQAISLLQLFLAIALYEQTLQRHGTSAMPSTPFGIGLAFAALLVAEVSHLLVAQKTAGTANVAVMAGVLLQQVVMIALAEELWFRGLWMRATADRPALAIFGGAAGFGLYHLHQGPALMATAAALGLLFAVARWHGSPIWALALAHGAMNWLNNVVLPAPGWRFDPVLSQALFIALILAGAWLLHWIGSRRYVSGVQPTAARV